MIKNLRKITKKEFVSFKPASTFKVLAEKVFEDQKKSISDRLPLAEVHHIGSTAILNSLTKGDLDVNVRVKETDFDTAMETLKQMYDINQPDNWTNTFASFKDEKHVGMDFGVQVTVIGGPEDDFVQKRDILLGRPDLVEALNVLKMKWEGKSMDEYRKAKGEFFNKMVK